MLRKGPAGSGCMVHPPSSFRLPPIKGEGVDLGGGWEGRFETCPYRPCPERERGQEGAVARRRRKRIRWGNLLGMRLEWRWRVSA